MIRRNRAILGRLISAAVVTVVALAVPAPSAAAPQEGPEAAVPSPGCGSTTSDPVLEEQRFIDVGGSERWFLLTVPTAHDRTTPLPIVVDFHGLAEGAQIHTMMSEFSGIAEREGFVVAFPQGRFDPVRWDVDPNSDPNEDLDFVEAMLESLGDELCLDQRRVYAAGLSFGAFMTSLVACALSDTFAAVAPVAGIRLPDPCPQSRDVPIVTFHGTDDAIVLFNGGFGSLPLGNDVSSAAPAAVDLNGPGAPAIVEAWAQRNGCDPTPSDTQTSDEILHRVYDCPTGADVEFYIVLGGGHTWPGSEFSRAIGPVVGHTTFDIHASEVAWQFFQRHALPCPESAPCDVDLDANTSPQDKPSSPEGSQPPSSASRTPQGAQPLPAVQPSFTG